MRLLYCTACPRGEGVSRTLMLAEAFLQAFEAAWPEAEIIRHDVAAMGLLPIDGAMLARREALIDARAWDDPIFVPAHAFAAADALVIAAPYWDLMFPAMLKVYIEHVFIREKTFRYQDDQPIGLCRAKRAVFLTTAGSPIGANDFGSQYLAATLSMLGIGPLETISADGLDIFGADVPAILGSAKKRAIQAANDLCR